MIRLYLAAANRRIMTHAEAEALRTRYAAGYGGLWRSAIPMRWRRELQQLAEAGFDGFCFSLVNYNDELPYFAQEVLPRLERMGLRSPVPA